MPKSAKACQSTSTRAGMPAAYYPLHSLLLTIRALACHEDQLCTLLTDIQRSGKVSARVRRELTELLGELPLQSLEAETQELWSALEEAAA